MEGYKLILHPTCPSSRVVVKGLAEKGLLDRVEVIVLDRPRPLGPVFPWSVPLIASSTWEPLAMDPLDGEEAAEIIESGSARDVEDPVEAFYWSIVYSAYASAVTLAHGSPRPLLYEPSFLKPALRLPLRGQTPEKAVAEIEPHIDELMEGRRRDILVRALAVAVARYYYWAGGRDPEKLANLGPEGVGAIILAMASIGRSNLPWTPRKPEAVEELAQFIARGAKGLLRKVEREHAEIQGDREYQDLLSQAAARSQQ